ncbi:MAG: dicarboxylate/amino acid:cation symporter [Candidatus Hydrogenedentes bacterium]|nr:dicarboxylate/amino acid:cation symporter [Candidatus Hydrogenedentota bacterium]
MAASLCLALAVGAGAAWAFPEAFPVVADTLVAAAAIAALLFILPKRLALPMQIFVAMIGGIVAGWGLALAGQQAFVIDYLGIFGTLFILLLKLVITPLIFVSIICGVAGIGDVRRLGSVGAKTLAYYACTTAVAVLIGLACVNAIRPGVGRESLREEAAAARAEGADEARSWGRRVQDDMLPKIIQNPIMAGQNPLAIIFFALFLGAALAAMEEKAAPALAVFRSLDKAFITLVLWIMVLAPVGVFALMAKAIATLGLGYIATLAKYTLTVVFGLGLHFGVLVFLLCPLLGRVPAKRFLRGMAPALELSFSTSSSSATLPVTIDCAARRVGADENISSFMLPIGATINMDGTALYTAVASLFIAQVYGLHLGAEAQIMVFLTAVLVSIGTAGIPGGSIALMPIILAAAHIPVEGIAIVIGVDRFLDMCRTVVNITGDSVGAVVVSQSEGAMGAGGQAP